MASDRFSAFRPDNDRLLTADDDGLHRPHSDQWWEHETAWYWFFIPERGLGCWIYHYVRPNIGVSGGGVLLFDDTAWFHMETPYYLSYSNMPMPETPKHGDIVFRNGVSIERIEPFKRHRLRFRDRDIIALDLEWNAIMTPWVDAYGEPLAPHHIDQFGHVTGDLHLHGEHLRVDCHAMRDRSWQHLRPEPWKDGAGGGTYFTAAAGPETSFYGAGPGGFLVLDGIRRPLVSGTHRRERDPRHGFMRRLVVEGTDDQGRSFEAIGESVSRMAMPIPGCHGVCWTSLVRYEINGIEAWGDDQDAWPLHMWSTLRRTQQGLKDNRATGLDKAQNFVLSLREPS